MTTASTQHGPRFAPPPPPPLSVPIPEITIKAGPPFPTVRPCAFPGEGDASEEEGDPDETCRLKNPSVGPGPEAPGVGSPHPSTGAGPENPGNGSGPADPSTVPNPSQNQVNCYNTGMWSLQEPMIKAIERFCGGLKGQTLAAGDYREKLEDLTLSSQQIGGTGNPRFVSSIEVKPGCKWAVNETSCRAELRKPVDQCNAGSANRKMGGDIFSNCLVWRIDTSYE
ncbi:exo-beta-D-glucanase [Colletotrichum sojae]|uniref:Exo-beta-D-glucanase n=1 Tax=Colletotrichum sojae TaxID=2175907 RepID=A0A8H6N1V3_9PEZI|nr:exo-beta-D-glucanase [Colletotrichum sojae]